MNIYLSIAIASVLGIVLHTFVKIAGINKRLKTTNYRQVLTEYWQTDWATVLVSFGFTMIIVFVSDEWLDLNLSEVDLNVPTTSLYGLLLAKIAAFVKTIAAILGYCADSAANAWFGGTERKLIAKAKDEGFEMDDIIKTKKDE